MKEFYSVENNRVLQHPRHDYVTDHVPDGKSAHIVTISGFLLIESRSIVWFDATEVWEIRGKHQSSEQSL